MKKLIVCLLIMLVILPVGVSSAQPLKPDANIKVFINGEQIKFEVDPIMVNNTTLVQFTPIFNKLNISYEWQKETKVITGLKDEQTIRLQINNDVVAVNDNNIKLSAAPQLFEDRTIVPLRFVSEAAGMDVSWDQQNKVITIVNAANPKVYNKPDYKQFMSGADFTTKHLQFLALIKVEPDHIDGHTYTFKDQNIFNYKSTVTATMGDDDKLSQYRYDLQTSESQASPLLIYRDINEQLEKLFGPPSQFNVIQYQQDTDKIFDVTSTITDSALIRGLRNDTHYSQAIWEFSDVWMTSRINNDGQGIKIYISLQKPPL